MMGAAEFKPHAEDWMSRHVPFSGSVAPGVVSTRVGDFASTWSIDGLSFEGLSDEQALARMDALNLLIRSLSNGHFAFWVHRIRRKSGIGSARQDTGLVTTCLRSTTRGWKTAA
jgi:type IV secretory pathway VirB4 component